MAEEPEGAMRWLSDVQRLELRPGDVLVFKTPHRLSEAAIDQLGLEMERLFPGRKCIVLEAGLDVAVLSTAQDEEVE